MMLLACRGCCCGTVREHPDVDHDGQLRALRATGVTVATTACLGPCRWSNVVVAVEARDLRRQWWFGDVLDEFDVDEIARWAARHDRTAPPARLLRVPTPSDRSAAASAALRALRRRHAAGARSGCDERPT